VLLVLTIEREKDPAIAMTEMAAVENMALENATMNVEVVNVNKVNAGVLPFVKTDSSANSDGKPSSGSRRNKYLYLGVALAAALMVAVPYGVGVGVAMGASGRDGGDSGKPVQASCSSLRTIRIAIAYDSSFCTTFGGADGAKREVERIVAMASTSWYSRPGLCVQLQIADLEGHCNSETDPYNRGDIESGYNGLGMLHYFADYWHTSRSNVSRDTAHLFRTQSFTDDALGCAVCRSLCSRTAYGVIAFSSTISAVQRAVLFAHELGHNAGADHIDPTEGDFIMEPFISGGKDGLSQASKDNILTYINSVSCIGTVAAPAPSGDFGNGEVSVEIKLKTDDHAAETSLALTRSDGSAVITGSNQGSNEAGNNRAYMAWRCVPANDCCTFTINDSGGDGICCGYGQGSFEVNVDGQRVGGGGEFGFQDNFSFGRCSVEVILSLRTDGNPEDTKVTLTDQSTGERLWHYSIFPKANANYSVFGSVDPKGCYVIEATASIAVGLRWEFGSRGFDLLYDELVVQSGTSFGSGVSYGFGEGC
jgi:hypothetical protein